MTHLLSEKLDAVLMNGLKVGDELLGQFADGSLRNLNTWLM
jgi:hypothetical protein